MSDRCADASAIALLLRGLMRDANLGWPDDLHINGPVSIRPQSTIYRLDLPNDARSFAVKQYFEPSPSRINDSGSAELQFTDLSRSFVAMNQNSLFSVPEPIYLFKDKAIVLMEWVDGELFLNKLCRRTSSVRTLMPLSRSAGAWLRTFHEAGSAGVATCSAPNLEEEIERVRIAMGRDNIVLTTASRALETLAEYIPAVSARLVLHSWLHGDFQPANIIFGPDKVYGIDITYSTRGVALADVAHILNHIRRLAFLPSGLHLLTSYQHILNAFLAGYCGEYSVVDSLVLSWYRLLDDLRFIIRYYPHIRSVHRWYIERLQSAAILQHVAMLHSSVSRNHPGRKIIGRAELP
jgi:aminoglycoside phosphotransferase (APT) family kinase protein